MQGKFSRNFGLAKAASFTRKAKAAKMRGTGLGKKLRPKKPKVGSY